MTRPRRTPRRATDVHHDGLDRQHHRAEREEQQQAGPADHEQGHPRQPGAEAGQLVGEVGRASVPPDRDARRRDSARAALTRSPGRRDRRLAAVVRRESARSLHRSASRPVDTRDRPPLRHVRELAGVAPVPRISTGDRNAGEVAVDRLVRDAGAEAGSTRVQAAEADPQHRRGQHPEHDRTPTRYHHGRRMTVRAIRAQPVPSSERTRIRRNDSALIRSPRIARPAGSTVSDAIIATTTAAIAPYPIDRRNTCGKISRPASGERHGQPGDHDGTAGGRHRRRSRRPCGPSPGGHLLAEPADHE